MSDTLPKSEVARVLAAAKALFDADQECPCTVKYKRRGDERKMQALWDELGSALSEIRPEFESALAAMEKERKP